jgi:hypothetical protein
MLISRRLIRRPCHPPFLHRALFPIRRQAPFLTRPPFLNQRRVPFLIHSPSCLPFLNRAPLKKHLRARFLLSPNLSLGWSQSLERAERAQVPPNRNPMAHD